MDRRAFLNSATAVGATLVLPSAVFASPLLSATAVRTSPERVKLDWEADAGQAALFVAVAPYAKGAALRPLGKAVTVGTEVAAGSSPRPYFLVRAKDGEAWTAERLLPLQGGRNFRDLGGYRSQNGKQVRWGKLYRSGVMSGLTLGDMSYLGSLGINTICDLRSVSERAADPTPFLKVPSAHVASVDYDLASSLDQLTRVPSRELAIQAFAAAYMGFIDTLAPQYTDMFARLARGDAPLAVNCSAGKDRTGVASALILSVLGVPRETVVADYALTQVYTPPATYAAALKGGQKMAGLDEQQAAAMRRLAPEVLQVIMGSDPAVMRLTLSQIDAKYGGPVELVKARFGVTTAALARMQRLYLA